MSRIRHDPAQTRKMPDGTVEVVPNYTVSAVYVDEFAPLARELYNAMLARIVSQQGIPSHLTDGGRYGPSPAVAWTTGCAYAEMVRNAITGKTEHPPTRGQSDE